MPGDLVWQQNGEQAQFVCAEWQARLDALRPAAGLSDVSYQGLPLAESSFLGLDLEVADRAIIADCYPRGGDFIVRYLQTAARPFAVMVYWRAGWFEHDGQSYPRIDLVVSVETSLLDSRPQLSAVSHLKLAGGPLVYSGDGCLQAAVGQAAGDQGSGFRVQNRICYVEMCHPGDSMSTLVETPDVGTGTQDQATLASGQQVRCLTRLFGQPLEKGVILRSRMRGLFVPQDRSEELARAALADLVHSPPPLTT